MADYPDAIYAPRTKENIPGIVYDAPKTEIGYVEDVTKLDDEVVAVETELGILPKWASASVKERLKGIRSLSNAIEDTLVVKGGRVGIGTAIPGTPLHIFKESMTEYELFLTLTKTDLETSMFRINASGDVRLGEVGYKRASFGRHVYGGEVVRNLHLGEPEETISHQLVICGLNPGIRTQIDRPSGYFALETFGAFLKNTTSKVTAGGGAIGAFGNIAVPETLYWFFGAKATTAYNDAVLKIDKDDKIGIGLAGTNRPTAVLDVNTDILRLRTPKTPASAGATGNQGDICWDADYIYICVATNTWKRVAIATW